ncbi:MAG: S1 RNA-binding domain-containing protein [Bacillota bacterium]
MLRPEGLEYRGGAWDRLYDAYQKEYPIEARISRVTWENDNPVWILDLDVAKGYVLSSETGLGDAALIQKFTGQIVFVKIKKINKKSGIVTCSRREAIADAREELFKQLKVGQEVNAVVRVITPKHLLVDVGGGVLVNVPRSAATKRRAFRLNEIFSPGQVVTAKVVALDEESDIISVTMVNGASPWETAMEFRRGEKVAGVVVHLNSEFVMVEMIDEPGLVGIADPPLDGKIGRGDRVTCKVKNFNREKKKLSLVLLCP